MIVRDHLSTQPQRNRHGWAKVIVQHVLPVTIPAFAGTHEDLSPVQVLGQANTNWDGYQQAINGSLNQRSGCRYVHGAAVEVRRWHRT